MAEQDAGARRVELVATATPERLEAARTGVGLMIGLYVGRSSLLGAATGSERFEIAVAHFVAVVLVSVAGVLLLGSFWDRAKLNAEQADEELQEGAADADAATPMVRPDDEIGIRPGTVMGPTS